MMKIFAALNISTFRKSRVRNRYIQKRKLTVPPKSWANLLSRDPAMEKVDWTNEKMVWMMLVNTSKTEPSRSEKALTIEDMLAPYFRLFK